MNPVHTAMMPMIAEIEAVLASAEAALQAPSEPLAASAALQQRAKEAVDALAGDDHTIPAAELVKLRREAAECLEVAKIEHQRAEAAVEEATQNIAGKLAQIGRDLEGLVVAEADRRKKIVFDALREILGTGAGRLPSLIENAAPWVSNLTGLQLPLRNMAGGPQQQIATIRQALAALGDAGPAILSK